MTRRLSNTRDSKEKTYPIYRQRPARARREKHQPTNVISQHMKSLLKSTCSKTARLIVLLAFSCGSLMIAQAGGKDSLFIGIVRSGTLDHGIGLAEGYLLAYSATDEVSDGDLPFNPHSSYLIYTPDGKLFKSVENHMSRSDEIPEVVRLSVGSYVIEARSERDGYVRVRIVIKAGRQTILDLDSRGKESPAG